MTCFWFDPSERYDAIHLCATLEQALEECRKAIAFQLSGASWDMDNEDLVKFCVGTVTHCNTVFSHIGADDECEELGIPAGEEIWECKLEEVKP